MVNRSKNAVALVAAFTLVALGACNKNSSAGGGMTADDGLLRFVPADTPYLLATGEPLPDEIYDKFEPSIDKMLQAYQVVLREVATTAMNDSDAEDTDDARRMSAIMNEIASLMSLEGLRNAGFERNARMALYGNGLLPVLRVELGDEEAFDAAIARIEDAAEHKLDTAEIDGKTYRYVGDKKARLLIGAFDGNAVLTFMPAEFGDEQIRQLLGFTAPKNSILGTSTIADIQSAYDYTNHYIGFIDARRISAALFEQPTDIDSALLATMDFDPDSVSGVCKAEINEVIGIAPRLVFGYYEVSADNINGSLVVEMRDDIAQGLSKIAAVVPGLGVDPGGLFSMGASFDLLGMREFYEARLDAIEADPYECEYFADLQDSVEKGRDVLNQPVPPVVYGFRGFNAVVDDIGDFDLAGGQPPEEIDASLLVALDDAQAILAMGAMFSPELAALNLEPNGEAVLVDLPQVQAMGKAVYAAMQEDAIAFSIGANAESRASGILKSKGSDVPPILSMTMDAGRYYSLIGDSMMLEDDSGKGLSDTSREALREGMLAIGEIYDRMAIDFRFTDNGLEMDSRVTLKD